MATRAAASRHVRASISRLMSSGDSSSAAAASPSSVAKRSLKITAVNRVSFNWGNRRSSTIAALPSVTRTNARRTISRTATTNKPPKTVANIHPRTVGGGSKNQSAAKVSQKAVPSHATPAAKPSNQIYRRRRRRSWSSSDFTAGANVGRSSWGNLVMDNLSASTPVSFYASFSNRRSSHSKHNRPHRANIIHRSQFSSCWGFGAMGRITVVVRSFS